MLHCFPSLPTFAVGGINLWDFNLKKVVPEAYIPCTSLGKEGTLGLCKALVPLQGPVCKEEGWGVFVGYPSGRALMADPLLFPPGLLG